MYINKNVEYTTQLVGNENIEKSYTIRKDASIFNEEK